MIPKYSKLHSCETNFVIGGGLAGLLRSPLWLRLLFVGLSPPLVVHRSQIIHLTDSERYQYPYLSFQEWAKLQKIWLTAFRLYKKKLGKNLKLQMLSTRKLLIRRRVRRSSMLGIWYWSTFGRSSFLLVLPINWRTRSMSCFRILRRSTTMPMLLLFRQKWTFLLPSLLLTFMITTLLMSQIVGTQGWVLSKWWRLM